MRMKTESLSGGRQDRGALRRSAPLGPAEKVILPDFTHPARDGRCRFCRPIS